MNQSEIEANICKRPQTRKNAFEQGMFGFGFAGDWLRRRHVFFPIIDRSRAKPKQK